MDWPGLLYLLVLFSAYYGFNFVGIGLVVLVWEKLRRKPAGYWYSRPLLLTGAILSAPYVLFVLVALILRPFGQ